MKTQKGARGNQFGYAIWQSMQEDIDLATLPLEPRRVRSGVFRISPALRCVILSFGLAEEIGEHADAYVEIGEEVELLPDKLIKAAFTIEQFAGRYSFSSAVCTAGGMQFHLAHDSVVEELRDLARFCREAAAQGESVVIVM